ncbi:hypothetical protein AGR7C_Cc210008 [Agrobacterium deltaense Zutra 3/1]|uniref:Uncharacterized protein n=2 Tax=Agrobacterium deltaense TaxID=1183412 RepID=A0A1S7PZR5_9HYPH|nr:hypothetical protein AGR7C_Cc210008 [Agrobacterium deltaense Zutra 3/1]CVI55922.1 hypothetical protein AGR7A_Cc240064 [Agrobacterium deltaense NCPPB 1641]
MSMLPMGTAQASSCVGNFITITLRIGQSTDWFSHDPKIQSDSYKGIVRRFRLRMPFLHLFRR